MFKWLKKKYDEQKVKIEEKENLIFSQDLKIYLQRTCEIIKNNDIENAIYAVWTNRSSIVVVEDFLYFYGTTSRGNSTYFHYGEAISLNKILSIQTDYESELIILTFVDGSRRYINSFNMTKELDRFFKGKVTN